MGETAGLDFSDTKPDPGTLVRGGFRFVVGYLKPLQAGGVPNPKELTADYIRRARAAGLAVAAVYETTTGRALSGAAGGAADGATARARAVAIGYPTSAVCFAAVDTDVTPAQFPTITAYLQAFAAAWGGPAGGYGELDLIEHLAEVAPALYRWQTEAWSGHRLSPRAHLFQRATPSGRWPVVAGTDEDVLCAPIPWHGPATAPTTDSQEDDMPPCLAFHNSPKLADPATGKAGDGTIALAAPGFWFELPSAGYLPLVRAHGWCGDPVDVSPNQFAFHRTLALSNAPRTAPAASGLTADDAKRALADVLIHGAASAPS